MRSGCVYDAPGCTVCLHCCGHLNRLQTVSVIQRACAFVPEVLGLVHGLSVDCQTSTRRGTGHRLDGVFDDASKLRLMQLPRRRIHGLGKRPAGLLLNGIGNRLEDQECWPISRMYRSCLPSLGKRLPWADGDCLWSTKAHRRADAGSSQQFSTR